MGSGEDAIDQGKEMLTARQDLIHTGGLAIGKRMLLQKLAKTENMPQGGAKLVADARKKIIPRVERGFQLGRSFRNAPLEIAVRRS